MLVMSVPILLALSDISVIAWSAFAAAAAVSPPSDCSRDAEKLVTVSMYSLALSPAVLNALFAYSCTCAEFSPKSVSTPPTSCSYSAYAAIDCLPTSTTASATAFTAAAIAFAPATIASDARLALRTSPNDRAFVPPSSISSPSSSTPSVVSFSSCCILFRTVCALLSCS